MLPGEGGRTERVLPATENLVYDNFPPSGPDLVSSNMNVLAIQLQHATEGEAPKDSLLIWLARSTAQEAPRQ